MTIQYKILLGYFISVAVIGSMASILLHERRLIKKIEAESLEIRGVRSAIHTAHRYITDLATRGESVITWEESDYRVYHEKRTRTDSLLCGMKSVCSPFVHPAHIDTLRILLRDKESHLLCIMQAIRRKEEVDSLLAARLPVIVRQTGQTRTVTRKKKGIAGWFGGKTTVQIPVPSKSLQSLNDTLVALQREQNRQIDTYADSLRRQNKELNRKLYAFITYLDGQAQASFKSREEKIVEAQEHSYRLFAIVIGSASVLLLVSFLIIRYDIGKERKGKARLQRINRENEDLLEMRKQIILTVSHDIRGPLGNINNCAELASDTREKKKREAYLENIRHSCRHILHLVNNLMDVYKINEARDTRNEVPFQLGNLLRNISEEYARKACDKALLFEQGHEVTDVMVKGDADKLEQVLDNLLTNAIKFTPAGTVRFHTRYAGGKLHVEIGDTGIGMDKETLKRVFRPFERAAQEVNSEGFGLGLFITKGLVKVLDGTLDVESRPGKGSPFRLVFPLPETEEETETDELPSQFPAILPKRVLVVDDDRILLKIAEDMLGRNGVECTTCTNVKEVVSALRRSVYDLMLTDIQMPVTDGFGLLKLLRGSDIGNSRTIPVAVMTARSDGDSGVYAKSGFCGCIHKPFSMKGLMAFISSVTPEPATGEPCFYYDRLMENTDDRLHMFDLLVRESESELSALEHALDDTDREAMRNIVHRMLPVWELLGAEAVLTDYRKVLHDRTTGDEAVREHTHRIMAWIQLLIDESRSELERNRNEDEKENTGGRG